MRPPVERRSERVLGRAEEDVRRQGKPAAAEQQAFVAHDRRGAEQLRRVEVKDALGFRLVAGGHVIACEAQDVLHAERRRAEQVALQGDAVAVTARHLEHGFVSGADEQRAHAEARHVGVRAGGVGGVDAVGDLGQDKRGLVDRVGVGGVGRVQFGGDGEQPGAEDTLESAPRAHGAGVVSHAGMLTTSSACSVSTGGMS